MDARSDHGGRPPGGGLLWALLASAAGLAACISGIAGSTALDGSSAKDGGGFARADAGNPPGGKDAGAPPTGTDAGGESTPGTPVYAQAGIRRLGRVEVERAAGQLLGISAADFASSLGSDTRQAGFTRNLNERLGSVQADALWNAAQKLASEAVAQRLSSLAPCTSGSSETCAASFIHSFAPRAYRRSTTAAEEANLLAVYKAGASGAAYSNGIELVIAAVLQAPSFLYVTELGAAGASGTTRLTGEEIATSLSMLLTGKPADDALMASGRAGNLDSAAGREQAARALLTPSAGPSADVKLQVERLVLEWVGADSVSTVAKNETQFPDWFAVRADMLAESQQIVDSVLFSGDGTIASLLTTSKTFLTPALAKFYGVADSGAVTQPSYRRGLMLAGAFVTTNSYPDVTAPVKRGAMVRKRLLCKELPVPTNLGTITVPPADPTQTARERFLAHSTSAACSGCHKQLDPPGFALEIFDTAGRYRTTENNKTIQTGGELLDAGDATGTFTDGVDLMNKIASSKIAAECFSRQLYRYASGRTGGDEEETFIAFVRNRPSALEGKVIDQLIDYVQSDSFVNRRLQ
jgi:hypothetical protein